VVLFVVQFALGQPPTSLLNFFFNKRNYVGGFNPREAVRAIHPHIVVLNMETFNRVFVMTFGMAKPISEFLSQFVLWNSAEASHAGLGFVVG